MRELLKAWSTWLFILAIALTVVVEGFGLSWGDATQSSSSTSVRTTLPASAYPNICAKGAKFRFIEVDYLRYGGGSESATVTGHVVTLHCGGPDDFQFLVHTTPDTVSLRSNARIVLLTLAPTFYFGTLKMLNEYLAQDEDGNDFLVEGPNSGATSLIAMFHP